MKFYLALALIVAVAASTEAVLQCYRCNSRDDSSCLDNPTEKQDCGHAIADLPANRFRCMTIHGKDDAGDQIMIRRCATSNECKWQVKDNKFEYGKLYTNAVCEECVGDYCNKDKFF